MIGHNDTPQALAPPPSVDPWTDCMRRGDLARAWDISDTVLRARDGQPCWTWPRHLQYIWTGQPLTGKRVLIRCYHGLGDTLQFIRYASLVKVVAREVIVWAPAVLLPLLQTVAGIDRLLPLHDGTPEVEYEVDVELMELPHVFRSTLETLPAHVPYLQAEPRNDLFTTRRPTNLEVGVVWQSGGWDERRSVPLPLIERWAKIPDLRLHALQRGPALQNWSERIGENSGSDDPMAAARTMRALDLVVTVDSMPAHLAGALGVPTWTLLHSEPDWRWMQNRDDSPWYPTMRLFRQAAPGNWELVTARVGLEMAKWAQNRSKPHEG